MAQYGIFFTQLGRDKIAAATAGEPLDITHIAVGDGGGGYPVIDDTITSLVNEIGRFPISGTSSPEPTQRQFSAMIDTNALGESTIRERGLIDADGDLIAIAQAEPIEIPAPGPNAVRIVISILATFNNADYVRAIVDLQGFYRIKEDIYIGDKIGVYIDSVIKHSKDDAEVGIGYLSADNVVVGLQGIFADQEDYGYLDNLTGVLDPTGDGINSAGAQAQVFGDKTRTSRIFVANEDGQKQAQVKVTMKPDGSTRTDIDSDELLFNGEPIKAYSPERVLGALVTSKWTARQASESNYWSSVTWSPELGIFVAVATSGDNRVMTSPDGINWTSRTAPIADWSSVTWSPELGIFVAVAFGGTNRVMTSPDGINWTGRASSGYYWLSVTWSPELGIFVAVSENGADRVMTSPDGINWTDRQTLDTATWNSVTWSAELGVFVAVASSGTDRVMTSPDGINWTGRNVPLNEWRSVTWSPELGIFVAVAGDGSERVMTSPDGINWTVRQAADDSYWSSVTWSPELGIFVAVALAGTGRVMTSWTPS